MRRHIFICDAIYTKMSTSQSKRTKGSATCPTATAAGRSYVWSPERCHSSWITADRCPTDSLCACINSPLNKYDSGVIQQNGAGEIKTAQGEESRRLQAEQERAAKQEHAAEEALIKAAQKAAADQEWRAQQFVFYKLAGNAWVNYYAANEATIKKCDKILSNPITEALPFVIPSPIDEFAECIMVKHAILIIVFVLCIILAILYRCSRRKKTPKAQPQQTPQYVQQPVNQTPQYVQQPVYQTPQYGQTPEMYQPVGAY